MKDTKSKPLHLLPSKRKDIKTVARHSLKDTKKLDMKWHNANKTDYNFKK
jgi:hypothetical protein